MGQLIVRDFKLKNTEENQKAFLALYPDVKDNCNGVITLKDITLLSADEIADIKELLSEDVSNLDLPAIQAIKSDPTVINYLRGKGYAWEWMGISTIEQINYGWITLRLKYKDGN